MIDGSPQRTTTLNNERALLQNLYRAEALGQEEIFTFDVLHGKYAVMRGNDTEPTQPKRGRMSLAQYNELKLSQYLVEDAEHSTAYERHFSLTDRGRHLANRRPN